MKYTKEESIDYQYQKIAYHFQKLISYGESSESILQKMLMSQALPKVEEVEKPKTTKLIGYLKYVKLWNKKEHESMFVKEGEENSSIELLFPLEDDDDVKNANFYYRLCNIENQKVKVFIEAIDDGFTGKGKPRMKVVFIQDYKKLNQDA